MRNAYYQLHSFINMAQKKDVFYYSAQTILEHIDEIPKYSITQVADLCFASTATISRLIRKLNYPSFNDFKQDVIYALDEIERCEPIHFGQEPVDKYPYVELEQLKDDFFQAVVSNLRDTNRTVSSQDIKEIVDYIDQASRVIFIGYNFGQSLSSQLQITLSQQHKDVIVKTSEKMQLELLQESTENDLIILTTITGNYFRLKQEAMTYFKNSPAKKIVITQDKEWANKNQVDKTILVGRENDSYIGKFSVLLIYEMIEMFYRARHMEGR